MDPMSLLLDLINHKPSCHTVPVFFHPFRSGSLTLPHHEPQTLQTAEVPTSNAAKRARARWPSTCNRNPELNIEVWWVGADSGLCAKWRWGLKPGCTRLLIMVMVVCHCSWMGFSLFLVVDCSNLKVLWLFWLWFMVEIHRSKDLSRLTSTGIWLLV
jgi:hypothetical protein